MLPCADAAVCLWWRTTQAGPALHLQSTGHMSWASWVVGSITLAQRSGQLLGISVMTKRACDPLALLTCHPTQRRQSIGFKRGQVRDFNGLIISLPI